VLLIISQVTILVLTCARLALEEGRVLLGRIGVIQGVVQLGRAVRAGL
jgi:hypothetical protein